MRRRVKPLKGSMEPAVGRTRGKATRSTVRQSIFPTRRYGFSRVIRPRRTRITPFYAYGPARLARVRGRAGVELFSRLREVALPSKNPEHLANRVEVGGLFWHFVDLVWIFLFADPLPHVIPCLAHFEQNDHV